MKSLQKIELLSLVSVVAIVILVPFGKFSEFGALTGLIAIFLVLATNRNLLMDSAQKRLVWVFGLFFLAPAALSVFGAVDPAISASRSAGYLRFIALTVIVGIFFPVRRLPALGILFGLIVVVWCFDAFFEFFTGVDWLGRPIQPPRINGPFDVPKLGYYLAPLTVAASGLLWSHNRVIAWFVFAAGASTVLISGDRGGWVSLFWATSLAGLAWSIYNRHHIRYVLASALMALAIVVVVISQTESVKSRLVATINIVVEDGLTFENRDGRSALFDTATRMFQENWLNGVGIRGFRFAYFDYADPSREHESHVDFVRETSSRTGQTHAHSNIFSIGAEMGILGLVGYVGMLAMLFRGLFVAAKIHCTKSLALWAAPLGAFFPFNAHLALASSHWAIFIWMLFGLAFATTRLPSGRVECA